MARADEEFAEFARASYPGLGHAAYLLTGDRHAAEDAVQTALARTYAAWSRVRRDDAYAYARKVLVNHVTDRWRRRLREYPAADLPDAPGGPDLADEVVLRQWISGALAALTARERAVVVLRYLFDLPEAAVAVDLGITVGTVKSTSSRALAGAFAAAASQRAPALPVRRVRGHPGPDRGPGGQRRGYGRGRPRGHAERRRAELSAVQHADASAGPRVRS